jgi:hypothetical protein
MDDTPMETIEPPGLVWRFSLQGEQWVWSCQDPDGNETARSRQGFDTMEQSQADAARYGYRSDA